ncbi:MAG: hypothetical protein AAFU77_15000 [Myxococcota bacterium]
MAFKAKLCKYLGHRPANPCTSLCTPTPDGGVQLFKLLRAQFCERIDFLELNHRAFWQVGGLVENESSVFNACF